MTARQPRRTRRRAAPASTLPRPTPEANAGPERSRTARSGVHHREHHVSTDYGYVRRDLVAVTVFASVVTALVVAVAIF